ncbi:sensor histidine kinase [Rhodococcus sp. 27YEA15]|uniref:sensor histidine kinase n=1 Tax=Rhodococcus sp. 27YEA15 TaxID=3156259 RepID=UPI003C79D82B
MTSVTERLRTAGTAGAWSRVAMHGVGIAAAVATEWTYSAVDVPTAAFIVGVLVWAWIAVANVIPAATLTPRRISAAAMLLFAAVGAGLGSPGCTVLVAAGLLILLTSDGVAISSATVWGGVCVGALWISASLFDGPMVDTEALALSSVFGAGFGLMLRQTASERRMERHLVEQRAETAVLGERARLARDIHDVLAHSLGGLVISLEALDAAASARSVDDDLLLRIRNAKTLAVEGLGDAKNAVDALRTFPGPLDESLGEIVRRAVSTGMDVTMAVSGDPRRLSAGISDVLVSVAVQALSNARSHAPGTPVAIEAEVLRDVAHLRISNPMVPGFRSETAGGHGVRGMRERVELVGGQLGAGEHTRQWIVDCEVPYV